MGSENIPTYQSLSYAIQTNLIKDINSLLINLKSGIVNIY